MVEGGDSDFYSSKDFSENWHTTPPGGLVLGGNFKFRGPPIFPAARRKTSFSAENGRSEGQIMPVEPRS